MRISSFAYSDSESFTNNDELSTDSESEFLCSHLGPRFHFKPRSRGTRVSSHRIPWLQSSALEIRWPPQSKYLTGCDMIEPPSTQDHLSEDCAHTFAQAEYYIAEMAARKPPAPPPPPGPRAPSASEIDPSFGSTRKTVSLSASNALMMQQMCFSALLRKILILGALHLKKHSCSPL